MPDAHAPTPTEHGVDTADGLVLHTLRWEPSRGETAGARSFLLVHGLASNALLWTGLARDLLARGHVVVAVDQRGHGRSTRPGGTFAPARLRDDLLRVIDRHRLGRPVLIGQSWGGNVVLDLAAHEPDQASAVVAVDGGTIDLRAVFDDLDTALEALRPPPLAGTPFTTIETEIRRMHPDWPETGLQGALANFDLRDDGTVEPRLATEEHLEILRAMWDQRPAAWFDRLQVPTLLLMVEDDDPTWASEKHRLVEQAVAHRGVSSRWLDGYEHDVHAQAPDVVARIISDWLAEVAP